MHSCLEVQNDDKSPYHSLTPENPTRNAMLLAAMRHHYLVWLGAFLLVLGFLDMIREYFRASDPAAKRRKLIGIGLSALGIVIILASRLL